MSLTPSPPITKKRIGQLLDLELPEEEAKQMLLELTPDAVDWDVLDIFIWEMRNRAVDIPPIHPDFASTLIDCCGTGGSGLPHFNTSTTVAFVLAAGGLPVVKFGNRAASSRSGSFDFLGQLGFPDEMPLEHLSTMVEVTGLAFLYAPQVYPTLGKFQALRKQLGVKTIFNYLGPMLNPLRPAYRLMGVSDPVMQLWLARLLSQDLANVRSLVVRGENGLDELSVSCPNETLMVETDTINPARMDPSMFLPVTDKTTMPAVEGSELYSPDDNVERFWAMMDGRDTHSNEYYGVCLNAGAAFSIADRVTTLEEGIELAQELIASGAVKERITLCRDAYGHLDSL